MNKPNMIQNFKVIFKLEDTICRLLAAWCTVVTAIVTLLNGRFTDIAFGQGISLTKVLLGTIAFFVCYSVVAFFFYSYATDSLFLMIAVTLCSIRWLWDYSSAFLFTMAVITVYSLFLLYFLHRNKELISRITLSKSTLIIIISICALVAITVIAITTCLRYMTFSTPNLDFGLFINMFHYMRETGQQLVTSERDMLLSHFAVHISPIYYLILPFYYLFPSPLTLQICQAVICISGVIPVVLLSKQLKLPLPYQFLAGIIYTFLPVLSSGCFFDLHENCFLAPLLLWMFYFYECEKYAPMYVFAITVLCVKEDAAIYIFVFALYLLLSHKKYLHGCILAIGSLFYFSIALYILSTYGDGVMIGRFDNLIYDSQSGIRGIIKTALTNPGFLLTQLFTSSSGGYEKFIYVCQLLLPLGFLPFCTKKASGWILISPLLLNTLTAYSYQYNPNYQYHFGIIAFLVYASLINLAKLTPTQTRTVLLSIATISCLCMYLAFVIPHLRAYHAKYITGRETYQEMEAILDTIPEEASVCASKDILSHVAERDYVYELDRHDNAPDVDYVIVDARFDFTEQTQSQIDAYLAQGYEVTGKHEGMLLIMQKAQQ